MHERKIEIEQISVKNLAIIRAFPLSVWETLAETIEEHQVKDTELEIDFREMGKRIKKRRQEVAEALNSFGGVVKIKQPQLPPVQPKRNETSRISAFQLLRGFVFRTDLSNFENKKISGKSNAEKIIALQKEGLINTPYSMATIIKKGNVGNIEIRFIEPEENIDGYHENGYLLTADNHLLKVFMGANELVVFIEKKP